MDDACTVRHRDIIVAGHEVRLLVQRFRFFGGAVIRRFILSVLQFPALIALQHLIVGASVLFCAEYCQHFICKSGSQDVFVTVSCLCLDVFFIGIYAKSHIGQQRPGCSRPREVADILFILRREAHYR